MAKMKATSSDLEFFRKILMKLHNRDLNSKMKSKTITQNDNLGFKIAFYHDRNSCMKFVQISY